MSEEEEEVVLNKQKLPVSTAFQQLEQTYVNANLHSNTAITERM